MGRLKEHAFIMRAATIETRSQNISEIAGQGQPDEGNAAASHSDLEVRWCHWTSVMNECFLVSDPFYPLLQFQIPH